MNEQVKNIFFRVEKWLEVAVITCGLFLFCRYLNPADPFFVQGQFPWPWIAPLLLSLRYGIAAGMTSAFLLVGVLLAMVWEGGTSAQLPNGYILGGLLTVLISGQFSSVWNKRLRRATVLGSHAGERFEQLSKAYFMVRLSHDRLEQNLISRPVTLRGAMTELRGLLAREGGELNERSARALMAILVHYCRLGSAAIYPCVDGRVSDQVLASCGRGAPLDRGDLLLGSALESGNTIYQAVNRLEPDERSSYLVAAPIRTSSGDMPGILLISDMPFLALERETLQIMAVILTYFADHAGAAGVTQEILAIFPDCPVMFAAELAKMVRLRRDLEIGSVLAVIEVPQGPRQDEICVRMERLQRGLDHSWRHNTPDLVQFVTLMPFSGPAGVEGFKTRMREVLRKNYGLSFDQDGLRFRSRLVTPDEPQQLLVELLKEAS